MLGISILSILAVLAVTSLFYPQYLVVTSGLEQSAIHAANSEIERYLYDYENPTDPGIFQTGNFNVTITNELTVINENMGGVGDEAEYVEIRTSVEYRDGKTVDLVTYRSLEVHRSER